MKKEAHQRKPISREEMLELFLRTARVMRAQKKQT